MGELWSDLSGVWKKMDRVMTTPYCILQRWRGYNESSLFLFISTFYVTSSNGNIFRVTDPLWGETTSHRWIPLTKASDAELWCFLWSMPEQTVEQTIDTPVIWEAIASITTSLMLSPKGSQTITSTQFAEVSRTWMIGCISQYSVRYLQNFWSNHR